MLQRPMPITTSSSSAPATPRAPSWPRPSSTTKAAASSPPTAPAAIPPERRGPRRSRNCASAGISTEGLRSKSWDEFAAPDAPQIDFVFTVCDNAANEVCPIWPGQPMTAHWGIPDPAAVQGTPEEIARAFRDAFTILDRRISLFLALPLPTLDAAGHPARKSSRSAASMSRTRSRRTGQVCAPHQRKHLSFLDRFLTLWIFLAMVDRRRPRPLRPRLRRASSIAFRAAPPTSPSPSA